MAGNARFHDKLHRTNHHTLSSAGYPDSGLDPIASPDSPFQGHFVVNGMLSSNSSIQFVSANIPSDFQCENLKVRGITTTNFISGDSTETIISDGALTGKGVNTMTMDFRNGIYAVTPTFNASNNISAFNTVYAPIGNFNTLTINNNANITGNLLVNGNLSALGDISVIETNIIGTSSLSVFNSGPSTALIVKQTGSTPIAEFSNATNKVLDVKTDSINISGTLNVSNNVTSPNLTNLSNTSGNWNQSYTALTSTSSNWNSVYNSVLATSANWNSVNSSVSNTSGNWNQSYTALTSTSANWNSVYTSVNNTSANWDSVYSSVNSTSGNWDRSYTALTSTSSNWDSVYSSVNSASGKWNQSFTALTATSANWNSVNNSVTNTSGNWNQSYTALTSTSANWNSVYTSVNNASASWNSVNSSVTNASGSWNQSYTALTGTSAKWDSTYSTVSTTSGDWLSGKSTVDFVAKTGNFVDAVSTKSVHILNSLYVSASALTATGDVTFSLTSPTYFFMDTNSVQRNIELPAVGTNDKGLTFIVKNTSILNNDVHLHYNGGVGGTPIAIIPRDTFKQVIANGSVNTWLVL